MVTGQVKGGLCVLQVRSKFFCVCVVTGQVKGGLCVVTGQVKGGLCVVTGQVKGGLCVVTGQVKSGLCVVTGQVKGGLCEAATDCGDHMQCVEAFGFRTCSCSSGYAATLRGSCREYRVTPAGHACTLHLYVHP